jgi:uncharacterized protein YbjT (DUF2867 family)
MRVTVLGGDGFIGRYVVQALLKTGAMVCVASRNPKRGWFLKAQANLGQIAWASADIAKPETLARAVAGADAVINLVGSFADMDALHVAGARNAAEAAAHAGVPVFVHLSAIGADAESASNYGRTKGEGEAATRAAFPGATILRPSVVFGREDQFINRFAAMIRMFPVVPVLGGKTRFQPIYVGDVARAVVNVVTNPAARGATYELGGPEIFSMLELNKRIAADTGRSGKAFLDLPDEVGSILATFTGWMPGAPITKDQWLMLQRDNVVSEGAKSLSDLGVAATPLEAVTPGWLVIYKTHGRFGVAA